MRERITLMHKPFETVNPQDFKLSVCWSTSTKITADTMTAEFSDCRWLPRIGEILVLPIDESGSHHVWHRFKVITVVYDFQKQRVRVWCDPLHLVPQKPVFDFEKFEKKVEAQMEAMEARIKAQKLEAEARLEYELIQVEDVDEELKRLKAQITGTLPLS